MRNLIRIGILLIYPIILLFSFYVFYKKYTNTIKKNYKYILLNSIIATFIIAVVLITYFHFEDTIYTYDYAGHWIRALTLRKYFYEAPGEILNLVYSSMNNLDYSYLPALFGLPLILIKQSYLFFALSNLVLFLFPLFIVISTIYFNYFENKKYFPLFTFISIFPLYLTLFYGKVDCCGLLFISLAYSLIILPKFEDITTIDNLSVNIFCFLAIFLRRWYLYSVICLYLAYFIKWIFYKDKHPKDLIKLVSSGIILMVISLLFFSTFITNILSNNFSESYSFYNHDGKITGFINYISILVCIICLVGLYNLFKKDKVQLLINLLAIILPCLLIWRIQSFEYHHYYIFLFNIIVLYFYGFNYLFEHANKIINYMLVALLTVQSGLIFSGLNGIPLFTTIRKSPEVLENKSALIDLSEYIKSIEPDENTTAFVAAGSYGVITDDLLRNALLPDLDYPNIDSAVFDIRDGFPHDFEYVKYVIIVDPIVYTDENYQHMFDVINNAITNVDFVSCIYEPIHSVTLPSGNKVTVYERVGDFTTEIKEYFYNEMIKYYPDKTDYFSYILD